MADRQYTAEHNSKITDTSVSKKVDHYTVPFKRFLGYDRGPDGNLVVNPEQAAVVQEIYRLFLEGKTPAESPPF